MRALVLRVAFFVAASLVFSFLAVSYVMLPSPEEMGGWFTSHLFGGGLGALRDDLAAAPVESRHRLLAEGQDRVAFDLALGPAQRVEMWVEDDPAGLVVHAPLGDGQELLVGPILRPARDVRPPFVAALVLAGVVLVTAWFVAAPIARRLRKLEAASRALRAGVLSTRVEVGGRDVIAELGATFNDMAGALERRVREREELLQAVAHEYGTPLTRMDFTLELLASRISDAAAVGRVDALRADLKELRALTAELLEWLRTEHVEPEPFEVDAALSAVLTAEYATGVALEGTPDILWVGDGRAFRRAIANLVRNAVRFAKGRVVVQRRVTGGWLEVVVDDDGPGIPPQDRERVFEPFARVGGSRDRAEGGTGLGLAIVRRIVERHGGSARVVPSPLGGARIVTRWALARPARAELVSASG